MAIRTITTRRAAETAPSGFFLIVCQSAFARLMPALAGSSRGTWSGTVAISASLVPDPRVEPRVGQIDEQVQRDQRRRDQHHVGLHDRIVAVEDRLYREPAPTRQREELLADRRPGPQN